MLLFLIGAGKDLCALYIFFVKVEFIESMESYMPKDSDNMVVCNKCIEECK